MICSPFFVFLSDQFPRRATDAPRSTPRHCTEAAEVPTLVPVHSAVGGVIGGKICGGNSGGRREDLRRATTAVLDIRLASSQKSVYSGLHQQSASRLLEFSVC